MATSFNLQVGKDRFLAGAAETYFRGVPEPDEAALAAAARVVGAHVDDETDRALILEMLGLEG